MISDKIPFVGERAAAAVVTGGEERTVTHRNGTTETVTVRLLPLSLLPRYQQAANDEARAIALFVDRPPAWVDGLTEESQVDVLSVGEELNLAPLSRFVARLRAREERISPGMTEQLVTKVLASIGASADAPSRNGSPESSAPAAG